MNRTLLFARRFRPLYQALTRRGGAGRIPGRRNVGEELIYAVLSAVTTEPQTSAALARLRASAADLNEFRVTPPDALVDLLGPGFPRAREAAEQLLRLLNGVFNRRHSIDLAFLPNLGRAGARRFLSGLAGVHHHTVSLFMLRFFGMRTFPLTPRMLACLRQGGYLAPEWSYATSQAFIERIVPAARTEAFYHLLKRFVLSQPEPAGEPIPPPPPTAQMSKATSPPSSVSAAPAGRNAVRSAIASSPSARSETRRSRAPRGRGRDGKNRRKRRHSRAARKNRVAPTRSARRTPRQRRRPARRHGRTSGRHR